jgi:hypothetical protein
MGKRPSRVTRLYARLASALSSGGQTHSSICNRIYVIAYVRVRKPDLAAASRRPEIAYAYVRD